MQDPQVKCYVVVEAQCRGLHAGQSAAHLQKLLQARLSPCPASSSPVFAGIPRLVLLWLRTTAFAAAGLWLLAVLASILLLADSLLILSRLRSLYHGSKVNTT